MKSTLNPKPGKDYIGVGCGALIVNDKKQVLLIRRGQKAKNEVGVWSQPGGTVEFGEDIKGAIKREIKEELGIEIDLIQFLAFTDQHVESQHWVAVSYLAKISRGIPIIQESEKHDDLRWFFLNSLPEKISEPTRESISNYKLRCQN